MKTRTLFLAAFMVLVTASVSTNVQAQDYYYYKGEKIQIFPSNQLYILYDNDLLKESDKAKLAITESVSFPDVPNMMWGITEPDAILEDTEHIIYQIPSYRTESSTEDFYISHRFYVQLKEEGDMSVLQDMADQYHVAIEEDGAFPLWYVMRWGMEAEYNALLLANIFFESGLFQVAQPEFLGGLLPAEGLQTTDAPVSKSTKLFRDGQLIIQNGDKTFNALGVEIK